MCGGLQLRTVREKKARSIAREYVKSIDCFLSFLKKKRAFKNIKCPMATRGLSRQWK